MPAGLVRQAAGRPGRYSLQAGGQLFAIIRSRICSDGMSDRAYGLDVDVVLTGDDPQHLVGCCSLLPD